MLSSLKFIFSTQPNKSFSSLCELTTNSHDLNKLLIVLSDMEARDIFYFEKYAEQRGSTAAQYWAHAEIKRREFIVNKLSVLFSVIAVIISIISVST